MDCLISIIVPVYDRAAMLPDCVRSVQAQSHQNFELLLIDDGSTDGSADLCQKFAARDSRIRCLAAQHGGVSAARNLGLENATGEYIFFLDSDDAIHPRLLETLCRAMAANNAALGGTALLYIPGAKWPTIEQITQKNGLPAPAVYRDHETTMQEVFRLKKPIFGLIGGVMLRRDLIGQTRFRTDLYIGEDFYFIYENLIKGASSVFLEKRCYYCRVHAASATNSHSYQDFLNRYLRRKLVWQSEEALGRPENAKRQKQSVFYVYLSALLAPDLEKTVRQQMQKFLRQHRKELLRGMRLGWKIKFFLFVNLPGTYPLLHKLKK